MTATTVGPATGPCPVCGHDMADPGRWIAWEAIPSDELVAELHAMSEAAMASLGGPNDDVSLDRVDDD